MNNLLQWMERMLLPATMRIVENRYMQAIRNAFIGSALPMIIVGSIFLIFVIPPIPTGVSDGVLGAINQWLIRYRPILFIPFQFTLGLAQGIGVSFYACAYHILTYDLTHNLNRDLFFAWIGTIGSALGLLTPVLSGWMIAKGEGLSGYYLTFSITLGLFLAAMILSLFFNKDGQQERFQLMDALLPTQKVHDWNRVLISQGLLGLRDGVFSFLVTMLLFFVFQNEFNMGKYTVLLSVIGMVATYIIGRIINHRNRLQAILIGGVMITLSTVAVAVSGNPVSVLLFTLAGAVFNPLWSIPFGSITFQVIDRMPDAATKRIEYISVREIPLGIGRIISLVLFLLIADQLKDEMSIRLSVLLIGTMLIGVWWVLRGIATEQRTGEEHRETRYLKL